jgi:hypothetical protein
MANIRPSRSSRAVGGRTIGCGACDRPHGHDRRTTTVEGSGQTAASGPIGSIRPPAEGSQRRRPPAANLATAPRLPRPALDQVELTAPHAASMGLLRERVLENTRQALGLERDGRLDRFAVVPGGSVGDLAGRLLSEQNLLAGARRGEWPEVRVAHALEDGMTQGIEETMQILFELDALDEVTWGLVCGVLDAFHRKFANAVARG